MFCWHFQISHVGGNENYVEDDALLRWDQTKRFGHVENWNPNLNIFTVSAGIIRNALSSESAQQLHNCNFYN